MKIEFEKLGDQLLELMKKYGLWVAVIVFLFLAVKRAWFWLIMPMMFMVFLSQLGVLFDWQFIGKINAFSLVISWVFIFSLISGAFEEHD